jgi:hypothetical protein
LLIIYFDACRDELVMKLDLCNDCHQGVGISLPLGVVINKVSHLVGQLFISTFLFIWEAVLRISEDDQLFCAMKISIYLFLC